MKVIIVGPAFPLRGGIADFNEALALALSQESITPVLYSFSYQYPSFLFPGTSQVTTGIAPEGIIIKPTISSINPFSWYKTARLIISEKPDLVIIRYWLPFMAAALGTIASKVRKSGIKIIAITDNVIPHEKRPGDSLLTSYFVKKCDGFITMSKSVLDDLGKFTSNRHKIFLPHPVYSIFGEKISKEQARKNLNLAFADRIILFFGFIRAYKGLDLLIEALADSRLKDLNVRLLVAGEFYEDKSRYLSLIERLGLQDRVILHTSFIEKEKVKDYFCTADMVVQPYRNATQSGITQVAYHFERPMLVTRVGGLAEIVEHGIAGYVTDVDPASIAAAISDFYSMKREEVFTRNVAQAKDRFTWKSFIRGILELYNEIG